MNQQKGFSLTEVLASLLLVSTLALALLQQQWQSKHVLTQLVLRTHGTQILDQIEESLIAQVKKLPVVPSPYHLAMQQKKQEMLLELEWYQQLGFIKRKLDVLGSTQ